MKKNIIILFIFLFVVFFSVLSWNMKNESENGEIKNRENISDMTGDAKNPTGENGNSEAKKIKNENHPRSIASLIKKEYDGTDFNVGEVLEQNSSYTKYYITYKSEGLKISGTMSVPRGEERYPVIVLNHGYIDPAIYINGRGLRREQDYFARNGYAVLHIDYRGHADSDPDPENGNRQQLAYFGYAVDAVNAVLALQKANLSYIDSAKIGLMGHSMGGGVAMNALIISPGLIDAAVLYAPVSSDYQKNFNEWMRKRLSKEEISSLQEKIGSFDDEENFKAFSPVYYFDRIADPIMIHHGAADRDVPVDWSRETTKELESEGKEVVYYEYPAEGHEFDKEWVQMMRRSLDFFDENLK